MVKCSPGVGASAKLSNVPLPETPVLRSPFLLTLSRVSREARGVRSRDGRESHAVHPQVSPRPHHSDPWKYTPVGCGVLRPQPGLGWGFGWGACQLSLAVLAHSFPELLVCQTLGRTLLLREASCRLTNTPFFFFLLKTFTALLGCNCHIINSTYWKSAMREV